MQAQLAYDINLTEELCDFTYFGQPVYRKSFNFSNLVAGTSQNIPIGAVGLKDVLKIEGYGYTNAGASVVGYPLGWYTSGSGNVYFFMADTGANYNYVRLQCIGINLPRGYYTVLYTKQ